MRTAIKAVVLLIGMAAGLMAQENTGNIYGHVTQEKAGIPGATAALTGDFAPRTTASDENGYFRFLRVPPGRYRVAVTMPGFSTVTFENVIVTLGKDTNLDVPISVEKVKETVTVTADTPLVDSRKVETGVVFTREELTQIPTSRDIYALMQQVPGIILDTVNVAGSASGSVGGPDFTTKGSGNVTYLVDGATTTDNSYGAFQGGQARQNGGTNQYFDFDTFDQVSVSTGGSLLDLQTPGTTINIVTKRGTNDLKGSGRFLYASDKWQANNTPEEAKRQGFKTNSTRFIREYGAEIGGPIFRDKLWFWGAASRQDISLNLTDVNSATGENVVSTAVLKPVTIKVNTNFTPSNSASLYFQRSDREESNVGLSARRPLDTTRDLGIPTSFYKLDDNHVFSPSMFASVFISYQDAHYNSIPVSGPDAQVVYDVNGVYHNGYLLYKTKNPQYQGNLNASKFFNTGKINHELKFGFNYRRQINDSASAWPGDQVIASEYSSLAWMTRGVRSIYKTEYYTGTLGDTLTTGNLTVNAGLRYDYQRGTNLPSNAPANPLFPELLPAVQFNGNNGYPFSFNNLEPRISATYGIGEKKTTLVRGSYARYADQLGFITYQMNGLPIVSGYYYDWTDANHDHRVQRSEVNTSPSGLCCIYNVDPAAAPNPANQLASNFKTPTTDELTIGADHQLTPDLAVSATYTYRHATHLQTREALGSGPDTWRPAGVATGTAIGVNGQVVPFNVPFYNLTLTTVPTGDIFLNRPNAVQNYKGLEVSLVKRLADKWMFRASGAWNNWKQNISPEDVALNPNNDWGRAGQNTNGGTVVGYSGKATTWVNSRWQFNMTGLYQFPLGINLGANLFGREGFPQSYYIRTCTRCADIDGTRYRNLVSNIDTYRLDNVYELDLRLEKTFNIGPVALSATAEVFNATNNATVLERSSQIGTFDNRPGRNTFTAVAFNQILETQSPRILRVGGRITF
jgi:outer membrane receptor protein involved in Fe transport